MLNELNLNDDAPWKQRFRAPSLAWSVLATQNPSRGLVCTNKDGTYQLYAWETETNTLSQLTYQPAGVVSGIISADGQYVYYLLDEGGNEIGHYGRVPFEGGEAEDMTPDMPAYSSFYITETYTGNMIGFMAATQDGFQMLVIDKMNKGTPLFSYQVEAMAVGPILSHNGEIAVIASTEKTGSTEFALEAYDVQTGQHLGDCWDGEGTGISPAGFSAAPDDMRFTGSTNVSGFLRPFIWNPQTGERKDIESDLFAGDINVWDWSDDGKRILLRQLYQAVFTLYIYHVDEDRVQKLNAPDGSATSAGIFVDSGNIYINWNDASTPAQLIELDGNTGEFVRKVIVIDSQLPQSINWESVTFNTSDGTPIQAWLATPDGEGPFPTIVHTHGGPTHVQTNTYNAGSQAWLDHGFAFFSINYRGSTTFGYDFQHAIDGKLGECEIDDIEAGVKWLIAEGIAQPDAILKTGGSYGGFLTLQSLSRKSDLWAGGMALVAVADWAMLYEDQSGTLKNYVRALFGGKPEEKPEAYKTYSPITYAENIKAEILVIQGENDTRCPSRQMKVYEEKLKSLGKSIHVHWFDAGHGSREVKQQIEQQELMLRFVYRVLG
jgi:dipeptidyl aminopeptidase/acylaminoacyl peptidase